MMNLFPVVNSGQSKGGHILGYDIQEAMESFTFHDKINPLSTEIPQDLQQAVLLFIGIIWRPSLSLECFLKGEGMDQ